MHGEFAIKTDLIAPCGMDCGICMAYLREKKHCPGCRADDAGKSKSCVSCKIKNCASLKENDLTFCFECYSYPCEKIKHIDKRYRTKYHMSMTDNLRDIRQLGIKAFVENERKRWSCPACGGTINVHRAVCSACGKEIKFDS